MQEGLTTEEITSNQPEEAAKMQVNIYCFGNIVLFSPNFLIIFLLFIKILFPLLELQMTDALCTRCNVRKVGLVDIIQAGHGDRYQVSMISEHLINYVKLVL